MRRGLAAEYGSRDALLAAIRALRSAGLRRLEAFSPVPSDEIDAALGARRSPLAIATGVGGLTGAAGAYALQWLLVARLYPVDVGGRPPHMPLPFAIITIEMGFLLGALVTFVAFIVGARLTGLWAPIFEVPGFESATRAGFWLAIDASDPLWDLPAVEAVVQATRPSRMHGFGGVQ
jgi:hypothetical protein